MQVFLQLSSCINRRQIWSI